MKKVLIFICLPLLLIAVPPKAFGWGCMTHAYFAEELGEKYGVLNVGEMVYGAMVPDMFNLKINLDYKESLRDQTHYEFMKVLDNAVGQRQEAYAYGFISHNDTWGVDYTAHHNGRTTPGKGYVITKVELLQPTLVAQVMDIVLGMGVNEILAQFLVEDFAPGLTELFVETAVDLMIKRHNNPAIGTMVRLAAQFDDFEIDSLLVSAYAHDFAEIIGSEMTVNGASGIIIDAEKEFRALMKYQGEIFEKDESETIEFLAIQGASIAEAYLKNRLKNIKPDVTVPPEIIPVFETFFLDHAIPSVEGDYGLEVAATLTYLEEKFEEEEIWIHTDVVMETPAGYSLSNTPNPFNPFTSIIYEVGKDTHVSLEVYNIMGQKVATIVDDYRDAGSYIIVWDATGFAAGVYVAVMKAEGFVRTEKMMFLK